MKMKRKLVWNDIKRIVEFKTFYLIVALLLIGIIFLLLEYIIFDKSDDAFFKGVFSSLGITFITSSTVSAIMEIFMRIDIVDFLSVRMLDVMPESIKGNTGVSGFYFDRKKIDFKTSWEEAKNFMKIIGVSSNDILASANLPIIKSKLESDKDFYIEILLLAPWSFTAVTRSNAKVYKAKNEGIIKTHAVIIDIQNFIESIKSSGIEASRVSIRLYDDIPSLSMVIDNKTAIVSPFMVVEQGGSSPYYVVKNLEVHDCLYQLYCDHFEAIWNTAFRIDEETDLGKIYAQQKLKDKQQLHNIPSMYEDWLLEINRVHKGDQL